MRLTAWGILASAALMAVSGPAMAAWHGYISHPLGFGFAAPGELKVEKGTYRSALAGERNTTVYRFFDDDIEYKAVVIDMTDKANNAANLLGEAEYLFQENKKVVMDTFGGVDRQHGRKLTVDLPNNAGRSTAAFFFINGRIVSLQATVLPANGDYETPEMGRFVQFADVLHGARRRGCHRTAGAAEIVGHDLSWPTISAAPAVRWHPRRRAP